MRDFCFLTFLFAGSLLSQAQDTIKVMSYNVLNYSDVHYPNRYNDLEAIVAHVQPDIVICQEMVNSAGAELLLDNAFNPGGGSTYARVTFINGPDSDNMLYYKTSKITFHSQAQITTSLRNITHYRVYHMISPGDTAWINLFSLHLKASTGEENQRLEECKDLCNYLGGLNPSENIVVGGDFNFYSSFSEPGWSWITSNSCAHRLYDPVNMAGNWNNNAAFTQVHSQSTRTANEPDGGSTGGLDDRFDFILGNGRIMNGLSKVRYVPGSYTVVGQDMNHFNDALTDPPANTVVPASVATALYNMSDHLPVTIQLAIGDAVGLSEYQGNLAGTNVKWTTSPDNGTTVFVLHSASDQQLIARIFDMTGRETFSETWQVREGDQIFTMNTARLPRGQYLLRLEGKEGWTGCKFIRY